MPEPSSDTVTLMVATLSSYWMPGSFLPSAGTTSRTS